MKYFKKCFPKAWSDEHKVVTFATRLNETGIRFETPKKGLKNISLKK